MVDVYNYLLRHHQDWMKHYYWAIHKFRPYESRLLFDTAMGYGRQLLEKASPSAIVSVHPMTQHFLVYILRKLRLLGKIPIITMVTDPCYGFWRSWACPDVQQYYVVSSDAKQQLIDFGVSDAKIQIAGMPIDARFHPVSLEEQRALRDTMGLDAETFTLFVNSGWVGGGNIPGIMQELVQADLPIQVVYLAGRNEKLLSEGYQLAEVAPFPVHVRGYSQDMPQLMNVSDVMVSKLGGLTTFEALASHLPIIADVTTPPMPQEEKTAIFLQKVGAGVLLERAEDIVQTVQRFHHDPASLEAMKQAAREQGMSGAADRIAQGVLHRIASGAPPRYDEKQLQMA
jgi:UDP-N-acetylglucosamine:LPS N-acetylglucosamine transferase